MCDNKSLGTKYIKYNEPNAVLWQHQGCGGIQRSVGVGTHRTTGHFDSMWIPPNMKATVLNVVDGGNRQFSNTGYISGNVGNPNGIQLTRLRSWNDHLTNCCTGKVTNGATPETCGQWWGKTDNMGLCDSIMETYCDDPKNKTNAKCSCYGVPNTPSDDLEARLLKAQPKCWSAICASRGYLPSNMATSKCPDVQICKQNISLPGHNNILKDNDYIQDCSQTNVAAGVSSTTGQVLTDKDVKNQSKYLGDKTGDDKEKSFIEKNMMLLIIIFVIIVAVYVSSGGDQYPPGMYPGMYPPGGYPKRPPAMYTGQTMNYATMPR